MSSVTTPKGPQAYIEKARQHLKAVNDPTRRFSAVSPYGPSKVTEAAQNTNLKPQASNVVVSTEPRAATEKLPLIENLTPEAKSTCEKIAEYCCSCLK